MSAAVRNSGGVLDDAGPAAGFFGRDQAGCSASAGCVKKSARNSDVLGCDEALDVTGFDASSPVKAGNVPAGLKSLGRVCGSSVTGSDGFGDDSPFWASTKAVARFKMSDGSGRVDGALTC